MKYNKDGLQTDYLTIKKFGWKRIAKNKQRFGWVLADAVKETTVTESTSYEGRVSGDNLYITPKTTSKSKIRINLSFVRDRNDFENLGSIKPIETVYNLIFLIRRILGFFLLPVFIGIMIFGAFFGASDYLLGEGGGIWIAWCVCFIIWLGGIILEGILSRVAAKILRYRQ